jgi:hypothetical protein
MDHILMYLKTDPEINDKIDKTNIIMFIRHNLLILSINQ